MLNIVLIKPYVPVVSLSTTPPLGILYLTSQIRQRFGNDVQIRVVDAKLKGALPNELIDDLRWADLVGVSAENHEAAAAAEICALAKREDSAKLTAIGGPYVHHRAVEVLQRNPEIDWAFDGESDHTFPEAIARHMQDISLDGILGLYRRAPDGEIIRPSGTDTIMDLDALPFPAWDMVDFDAYNQTTSMNQWQMGKRYSTIFTSRGCPYKCAYCHDIFGKKFRWRSAENVVAEMRLLIDDYGVDEFQIVDDIFNLHKPRLRKIFQMLEDQYGTGKFHICFPNGLRGDILDEETMQVLRRAGTYQITVAVETATPRLQTLIQKNLDIEKVRNFINYGHRHGILMKAYFMLGFPTETKRELWNTIKFALTSNLTLAGFFTVLPQPATPLYALAEAEGADALTAVSSARYYGTKGWYELAIGVPLRSIIRMTVLAFYFLSPRRLFRILRFVGLRRARSGLLQFLSLMLPVDVQDLRLRYRKLRARKYDVKTARPLSADASQT